MTAHPPLATIETPAGPVSLRYLSSADSFAEITALLHEGYASLAAMGFRYYATHQPESVTRDRCEKGPTIVGMLHRAHPIDHATTHEPHPTRLIATITVREIANHGPDGPAWYQRDDVTTFGQFTVHPDMQRLGIGETLIELIEEEARRMGAAHLACDTSEGAAHLIKWYNRLGYTFVQHHTWAEVNYRSVVLSKAL
jgi:GNAT superfamily N-acetyltransferase